MCAKTRFCGQPERLSKAERDRRDPVTQRLQDIEKQEAQKRSLRKEKNITVKVAADRWQGGQKFKTDETSVLDGRPRRRIQA